MPPAAAILALADADGRLQVRVTPSASAAIALPFGGALFVRTTAPPADGKANDAGLVLLAKALDRPVSTLELVRGAASRTKLILLAP